MKAGHEIEKGLRIVGRLDAAAGRGSWLAAGAGRRRRPRWVLKVLPAAGAELLAVLRPDILDLASLRHPALALPQAFGTDPALGRAHLLRPFVEGAALPALFQALRPDEAIPWLARSAEALDLLHRAGFLHRNLKPSNLLVPRGSLFRRRRREAAVVLCDPAWWPEGGRGEDGGARDEGGTPEASRAPVGGGVAAADGAPGPGRMGELLPERRAGAGASAAADLYALGAAFYHLLAGKAPALTPTGFPLPLEDASPETPVDLARVVMRLLHPDPDRSYPTTGALLDDLRGLCAMKVRPSPPPAFHAGPAAVALVREALTGDTPPLIAIAGEGAAGKTTLLGRVALEAQVRGFRTLQARSYAEGASALAPLRPLLDELAIDRRITRRPAPRAAGRPAAGRAGKSGPTPVESGGLLPRLIEALERNAQDRRLLVLIDDVHLADSLTLDLLAALARRRCLGLAVAHRSESPFRSALHPLLEALGAPASGCVTVDLAAAPAARSLAKAERGGHGRLERAYLDSLSGAERRALEALAVLGRPASRRLLRRITGLTEPEAERALAAQLAAQALVEEGEGFFFRHASFHLWLVQEIRKGDRQALHGRIAPALEEEKEAPREEIAHHWLRSATPERGLGAALDAARGLMGSHQPRRALRFFRSSLALLPRSERRRRRLVAEETAAAHAGAGEHRRGAEIVGRILRETPPGREAGRLHGLLGIYRHRAGEVLEAVRHLEKGLALLRGASGRRWLRERLRFHSELAEVASNRGEYRRAENICRAALDEIARKLEARRDREVMRQEMVLLETLAHLELRRFRYGAARRLFERSLRAGRRLELPSETALTLNNLGTLHIQESRFREAIACYEEARDLSRRLADSQSLTVIEGNLAALHAKIGASEEADRALARAAEHDASCDPGRARLVRLHNAGLVDLCFGRYASAIESLEAAIALGEELKDAFLTAFDLVYLGECHIFRGEAGAARAAFDRALEGPRSPPPLAAMAAARGALLAAMAGDGPPAREAMARARAAGQEGSREVHYLEAWNAVFRGWASRLLGADDDARSELEAASAYFAGVAVPWGEIHSQLELAALETDGGDLPRARRRLGLLRERFACGRGPLKNPMLSARLLLYQARVELEAGGAAEACVPLLVEGESFLVGRRLRDLEAVARDLRRRLRALAAAGPGAPAIPPRPPAELAAALDLASSLRQAAADLERRLVDDIGEEGASGFLRQLREFEERLGEAGRSLEGREPAAGGGFSSASLVGGSEAIRRVARLIRQVAPAAFPVLITGETGTGKELAARALHGESPRRGGPFVSVHCATLPEELLEAELFGYTRGAFSGAETDRDGLLRKAQGGSFFLDEIGGMPPAVQAKLLRLLDRRAVRPLGSHAEVPLDVRFIFATNRDLAAMTRENTFRHDLYFRLRACEVVLPPLRERLEDLPALVLHFLGLAGCEREAPLFDAGALRALAAYPWPGNVRELENTVSRLALTAGGTVSAADVERLLQKAPAQAPFSAALLRSRPLPELAAQLEKEYVLQAIADRGGDLKATARALGIGLRALYARFDRLGIRPRELG